MLFSCVFILFLLTSWKVKTVSREYVLSPIKCYLQFCAIWKKTNDFSVTQFSRYLFTLSVMIQWNKLKPYQWLLLHLPSKHISLRNVGLCYKPSNIHIFGSVAFHEYHHNTVMIFDIWIPFSWNGIHVSDTDSWVESSRIFAQYLAMENQSG